MSQENIFAQSLGQRQIGFGPRKPAMSLKKARRERRCGPCLTDMARVAAPGGSVAECRYASVRTATVAFRGVSGPVAPYAPPHLWVRIVQGDSAGTPSVLLG